MSRSILSLGALIAFLACSSAYNGPSGAGGGGGTPAAGGAAGAFTYGGSGGGGQGGLTTGGGGAGGKGGAGGAGGASMGGAGTVPDGGSPDSGTDITDAAVDHAPGTGGAGGTPATLNDYFTAWEGAYERRLASCFHASTEVLALQAIFELPALAEDLRLGLMKYNPTAAAACLAALGAASCDDVLALGYRRSDGWRAGFPACAGVLTGQVATHGPCLETQDCRAPGDACGGEQTCGVTCVPRPAPLPLGSACSGGDCVAGTVCGPDPLPSGDDHCRALGKDGAPCQAGDDCTAGFYCSFALDAVELGKCRAAKPGGACDGTWACPFALSCVGASPGHPGTCQAGHADGETCAIQGKDLNENLYSDCAYSLVCLDSDGGGLHCRAGSHPGQPCGAFPAGAGMVDYLPCLDGTCLSDPGDGGATAGKCQAFKQRGEACAGDEDCRPGLLCLSPSPDAALVCSPPGPGLPVGSPCIPLTETCAQGTYCHADPPAPDGTPADTGKCQPWKKVGEACPLAEDQCEHLANCVDGKCTRCPAP